MKPSLLIPPLLSLMLLAAAANAESRLEQMKKRYAEKLNEINVEQNETLKKYNRVLVSTMKKYRNQLLDSSDRNDRYQSGYFAEFLDAISYSDEPTGFLICATTLPDANFPRSYQVLLAAYTKLTAHLKMETAKKIVALVEQYSKALQHFYRSLNNLPAGHPEKTAIREEWKRVAESDTHTAAQKAIEEYKQLFADKKSVPMNYDVSSDVPANRPENIDAEFGLKPGDYIRIFPYEKDKWQDKSGDSCGYQGYDNRPGRMTLYYKFGTQDKPVKSGAFIQVTNKCPAKLTLYCTDYKKEDLKGSIGFTAAITKHIYVPEQTLQLFK